MEIFGIIGLLTAYFRYRNAKNSGALKYDEQPIDNTLARQTPRPKATRLHRLAQWLGLVEGGYAVDYRAEQEEYDEGDER